MLGIVFLGSTPIFLGLIHGLENSKWVWVKGQVNQHCGLESYKISSLNSRDLGLTVLDSGKY